VTNDASPSANVESSPGTYKIMTIIATVLCLCLLGASIFLGSGAHSQSTKAAQTRADTESLRAKKKDAETETANVRTQITSTKVEGSAKTWCDEFTSAYSTPKSLTNASGELSVKTQNQRDAIAQLCPEKKAFVEALHASPESSFQKSSQTCEITDEGLTFSETMTITNKQLSDLGDIDVTVDLYYTKGTKPAKDAKPIGTFSFTISSGGSATYSENLPDPGVPGGNCITKVQSIWMSGL